MTGTRARRDAIAVMLLLLLSATPLSAHVQPGQTEGFLTGMRHPVSGLDHVLAMIAVGLWGAQLGAPAIWLLPVTFPMMMAVGGFLALIGVSLPGVEVGIAVSALALGMVVAMEVRPRMTIAAVIVGMFAIFHGYAHGAELPAGQSGVTYSIGFVISTGLLHATGITIGLIHRYRTGARVLRLAGAGIALAGVWFLWSAIR